MTGVSTKKGMCPHKRGSGPSGGGPGGAQGMTESKHTLNGSRENLADPRVDQRTWRKQGKRAWLIQKHSPPKTQVGTCVWKLHFGSDQQKEIQKGGKGGCLNSQTSCEFPKQDPHQPQVSPTGDPWAEISMLQWILSSLRHNALVNFRNMNTHQSPSLSATREHPPYDQLELN